MTTQLLPCPFCGTEDVQIVGARPDEHSVLVVQCMGCNVRAPFGTLPIDCVIEWNTRALPSEGNRERSERTAEGGHEDWECVNCEAENPSKFNECGNCGQRRSPPASASMSAGVTDAMVDAAFREYLRLRDGGNSRTACIEAALEASERARSNTRAGVVMPKDWRVLDFAEFAARDVGIDLDTAFKVGHRAQEIYDEATAGDAKGAG